MIKRAFLVAVATVLAAASAGADEALFDGVSLEGWKGDPKLWRVEDGVIVGETDDAGRKIESNTFLIWEGGKPSDFELTLKARVTGNNSGVQYRSKVINEDKWQMGGYQMDMHPNAPYLGMLYEEKGRGIACQRGQKVQLAAGAKPAVLGKLEIEEVDLSQWNEYRIVARKQRLQHFVNGKLAAQITDLDEGKRSMEGAIGLQLHVGPAMRAEFKDISLKALAPVLEKGETKKVSWIWGGGETAPKQKVFFLRGIKLPDNLKEASIVSSCDNFHRVWFNGKELGMSSEWAVAKVYDVGELVIPGAVNVIAVEGRNEGGAAGLAMSFRAMQEDGTQLQVVSDGSWLVSGEAPEDWMGLDFQPLGWKQARVVAEMGDEPWGMIIHGEEGMKAQKAVVEDSHKVLPGFQLERLYTVPAAEGSWVAMTVDDEGRLICSDQYGGLYRVVPAEGSTGRTEVEKLEIPLGGAHGLLWFQGALYVTVNEGVGGAAGVYRVDDVDGDGTPETPKLLKEMSGRGEHGPHSLVPSPDGEWIYFCAGNHTELPKMDGTRVARVWGEDQLLPRRPDARGHARDRMAPGGWIARFRPDGTQWELMAIGFRNEYDLAFNGHGDLFAYDADMEWDLGLPWYRPTRICQVVPGAEFGWRNGTGKWPAYSEDSMPAAVDMGPGSPTGLVSGKGAKFPAKYQRALYALDWTYATIHVVHLTPEGAGYTAEREELVAGNGLPLTDAVIGKDGAMYFLTGGRRTASGLWRVSYVGEESTELVGPGKKREMSENEGIDLDFALISEVVKRGDVEAGTSLLADLIASDDRVMRFSARAALELFGAEVVAEVLAGAEEPWAKLSASIAMARLDAKGHRREILGALGGLDWESLDKPQKLAALRALGLVFIRGGEPTEEERAAVLSRIDGAFPAQDEDLDRELCRMLSYLQAPGVVGRTLALMDVAPPPVAPDWLEVASRNAGYGGSVSEMIENLPPAQVIHYVYCLRVVDGPWERSERERFFGWLNRLETKSGGKSYGGFLADLRKETLATATAEERKWLEDLKLEVVDPFADLPEVAGPGRAWTVEEVVELAEGGLENADRAHGKEMFRAVLCAACHSFGGQGGSVGPDLSTLAGRFTARDLAEAMIEPSKVVSDQYAFDAITKKGGGQVIGRILEEKDEHWIVAINPFDLSQRVEVERNEISEVKASPVSPMPAGLINRLNQEELRDLLSYLLGK